MQANIKMYSRDQWTQTKQLNVKITKNVDKGQSDSHRNSLLKDLKGALGRNIDLDEIEQALEDLK